MTSDSHPPAYDDEIDLRQLAATLWAGRWWVMLCALLAVALSVTYALNAPEIYRSETTLQVREEGKGGGMRALAGQLGAFADLAGASLGSTGSDRAVALATLKSRLVVEQFISSNNLLPILFAQQWDAARAQWKSPAKAPTTQDGYKLFASKVLTIADEKKTGLVTVGVEWTNPAQAHQWLVNLIEITNRTLKARSVKDSENNLGYLDSQAKATVVVEVQRSIYSLMETELKKLMLAKNGEEFAFRVIDPAQLPEKHIRPKRAVIVLAGGALGLFAGVVLALFLGWRKQM